MAAHEECMTEVDKKLRDHDRRHADRLTKCRSDVTEDIDGLSATLARMEVALTSLTEKASTMEQQLASLTEVNAIWNNYKGFSNTVGWWFGPSSWKVWLLAAAVVYFITHDKWPVWLNGGA